MKKGDLILSNSMSFGRPYILNIDGAIHDGWLLISDIYNKFNKEFLRYYLESDICKHQYSKMAAGGVVSNLNKDIVKSIIVSYPDKIEQDTLAYFLCLVDKKINLFNDQIITLKKYKKGIINLWFKNIGKTAKLIELVKQQTSQLLTHQIKDNFGVYPVYDATGKIYKFVDFYMNSNDSIAIIKYGSGCGRTFIACDKHSVLGTMSELIPLNPHDLTYIFAFTESTKFKKLCKKYIEVGTTPNLYYSDYSTVAVYYPDERKIFVKLIDLINKKCNNLEKERENLYKFKRKLLKDMFI